MRSLYRRLKQWWRTRRHGPVVHCRCGIKRSKRYRCPDCGRLYRNMDGSRIQLPVAVVDYSDQLPEV